MSNQPIAELIARKMVEGLIWPGDPERGVKPRPIALPFMHAAGRPKEMNDLIDETVKQISEAVVAVIETDAGCEIVPRGEVATLRRAAGEDGPPALSLTIECRCGEELAALTLAEPDRAVVNGTTFLSTIAKRSPTCPHGWSVDDQS